MNNNGSNLVVDFPPALYILAPSLGLNVLESSNATNAKVYQQSNYELAGHMARIERSKQMAEPQKGVGTDAITAIIAAILALANALDKKGALSFEEYRNALLSMYREMPHEDASGDPGLIFDGMLTQLERAIRHRKRQM